MVRPVNRDIILLGRRSETAAAEDAVIAEDLVDTLRANAERCVGMAANMIGVTKRIIAFDNNGKYEVMFNPELVSGKNKYETEEGCLSLDGVRKTKRYRCIKVRWQTADMQWRVKSFDGFTAQIIQHELDHLEGIII